MSQHILGFSGLREITNVHPVFTHFPIALYPATLLLYAIGILGEKTDFLTGGRACLYMAASSGVATALTGLKARGTIKFNPTLAKMVTTHLKVGVSIFILSLALVAWSFLEEKNHPKGEAFFLAALVLINYLTLQNADIGSRMVYVQGAGVKEGENVSGQAAQERA